MDNIQIINVRPNQETNGAYVAYSAVLKPTDHTINGNFTATSEETKQAFQNNQEWNGFKQLVVDRIKKDINNLTSK